VNNPGTMSSWATEIGFAVHRAETANVLAEDDELAEAVAAKRRPGALRAARAAVVRVAMGTWDAQDDAEMTQGGFGFLVLDGLLVRRVGIGERIGAELLGPSDLLRPLDHDGEDATLPFEAAWQVLEPARLAVLDRRWVFRMAPFPEVGVELTARAMRRSRRLANTLAISHHPRLDARLLLILWELADRYGTVRREGVYVPVRMTHEVLSQLCGARRPSVSAALSRLTKAGSLERDKRGWLLHGEPPTLPALPSHSED
jgi:CRP/FNR family transcriptional regulator, cyclic AMP receptor protein